MRRTPRTERLALKALMARHELTSKAVAEAMNLAPTAFSGMLNGSRLAGDNFGENVRAAVAKLAEENKR